MGSCLSTAKVDDNRRLATIRMLSLGKTESYSALKDHPEIKKLILKRLEFKDVDLPDCDSVELIAGISKLAKANAMKTSGKEVLLIVGNTGGGKSTCVNFLGGCELELL